ncbi:transmembrane protein 106C-like isoform X3 [Archocentrus centrarchus]|uniref:transmembrane protein 106C-like isoform X3 n=1 Tax=Archocentrus centrarchus TaxID=63155 RepID=UPI0011EA3A8A|nr:transmembrane protein 106C-like isoform X3 [Archocentrus centrarchus]
MGTRWSRSGSRLSLLPEGPSGLRYTERRHSDNDSLDGLVRREDIAQFPYVEFTGRDSITCPTCQGTGRIPSEQVNELVALIPYSDQRLQPQRTKLYVGLSVVLCLLVSSLVVFFLFPRLVVVVDDGIRSVIVRFDRNNTKVLMNMTSTLNFSNPNFFSVHVQSITSQVLYMQTVIGTQQLYNVTTLLPLNQSTPATPQLWSPYCMLLCVGLRGAPAATLKFSRILTRAALLLLKNVLHVAQILIAVLLSAYHFFSSTSTSLILVFGICP